MGSSSSLDAQRKWPGGVDGGWGQLLGEGPEDSAPVILSMGRIRSR